MFKDFLQALGNGEDPRHDDKGTLVKGMSTFECAVGGTKRFGWLSNTECLKTVAENTECSLNYFKNEGQCECCTRYLIEKRYTDRDAY